MPLSFETAEQSLGLYSEYFLIRCFVVISGIQLNDQCFKQFSFCLISDAKSRSSNTSMIQEYLLDICKHNIDNVKDKITGPTRGLCLVHCKHEIMSYISGLI